MLRQMALNRVRSLAWSKADPFGAEFVEARSDGDTLSATGVAIGSSPLPYRLDYSFETGAQFVAARMLVSTRGNGWQRKLSLTRLESGAWQETFDENGRADALGAREPTDVTALAAALDVDLGLSPLFNSMPALRAGLLRAAGSADFVMAWISVPDLTVHRSLQRYSFVRLLDEERSLLRFESLDESGFVAELSYDAEGFVLDYPGIATRLSAST